ncbi:MAG: M20 family metallopeptidase [Corynebacterium sp.]|uniref:M20 family metallopeptidase n=1 Tax=Corynebacterium sp. TaxID=1720 RepID=UPI0026DEA893|nr:M20 family metallopeptidase [Corynebacterium sp.]MDO5670075.1 M20 family metallopeptidase [Corynebacterium sp.]
MTSGDTTTPSTAFLDHAAAGITARMAEVAEAATTAQPLLLDAYPRQDEAWRAASISAEALEPTLTDLLCNLHAHPELAFEEVHAQATLSAVLEARGCRVEQGSHDVGTALRTEWTSLGYRAGAHRTVAIMAEYDALPGIGHACGHNIIAAAGVGGFLAAIDAAQAAGIDGRLVLLGTPAEEGHSGKEYMIRGGMLDDIDIAIMVHPFGYDISSHYWLGRRTLHATFRGVAAHASSQPFMGRNALDAATLAYQAMGLLRQQMAPSDRLHAVITDGGQRPSVIPEQASLDIYVRSLLTDSLVDLSARVDDILDGAALMTGCQVDKTWDVHPATLPIRNNEVLAERWTRTQALRGRMVVPAGVVPDSLAASTDFGNVSQLVPGIHPMVKVSPPDVALHTAAFASWAAGEEATRAAVDSAAGLAQVAVDVLADDVLAAAAVAEFEAAGGRFSVAEELG